MELKQIKELMAAMGRTGTKRLKLKKENFELFIEREEAGGRFADASFDLGEDQFKHSIATRTDQALSRGSDLPTAKNSTGMASEATKVDANSKYVTSPMVGTFYTAPSPEDPPFVKVGDRVDKNTLVCIIEAMKVMNEIKANLTGTIVEVLVEAGQPVEFGTKLFRVIE